MVNEILKKSEEEHERSNSNQSHFAFLVHELRAPLINIGELLKQPNSSDFLQDMETCLKALQHRIADLPEAADRPLPIHLKTAPFTIGDLQKRVLVQTGFYANKDHKIEIEFDSEIATHEFLQGDKCRIEQILINFISNAAKFSPKNGKIVVGIKIIDQKIEFSVRDEGPGIAKKDQPKLFRAFSQVGTQARTSIKTSGLGLAYCQELATILNSSDNCVIGVESDVGQGACFWFVIPLSKLPPRVEIPPHSPTMPPPSRTFYKRDLSVLLADDCKIVQKLAARILQRAGCNDFELKDDGQAAWGRFLERDFDVVILDMHMLSMGGLKTAQKICTYLKEHPKKKRPFLIIASAQEDLLIRPQLASAGIENEVTLLSKPLQYTTLVKTINDKFPSIFDSLRNLVEHGSPESPAQE